MSVAQCLRITHQIAQDREEGALRWSVNSSQGPSGSGSCASRGPHRCCPARGLERTGTFPCSLRGTGMGNALGFGVPKHRDVGVWPPRWVRRGAGLFSSS